jgi:hypothetical protein
MRWSLSITVVYEDRDEAERFTLMASVDLVTLAAMLGHSRVQMVMRYAHPTEEHKFQAMRKMEKFVAGGLKK